MDEITSGLDSENALIVMKLLKKMCVSLRVAAAVVIHQPSMEVFERFDRLVLLSRGRSIYSDKLSGLPTFYDDVLQHKMPETHHIPTDLLRHASNWECQLSNSAPSDSVPIVNDRHAGRDAKQDSSAGVGEETMSTNGSKSQPPSQHGTSDLPETSPELFTSSRELQAFTAPQVSMFWKFRTVFSRNLQNHYVRNLTNLAARLVIYGSTSLSVSLIFWDIGNIDDDPSTMNEQARYVVGAGLFLSQCSFLLPFSQISTFFFDKSVFASESALALYPSWMYSVSQFLLEAWVLALASLVQTTIAKPMMSLSNPAWSESESFFTLLAFFIISGLTGNALILLTCMVAFSQDLGFLLGCTVVTISLAASGGFVPFAIIPESIRWLQWISPVKYSLQIFIMALFDGTDTTIVQALDLDVPSDITHNILVLIFMFALCAVTTIVTMSFQREVR
uniref:ABC-2 type transporter transmembrane domain-containing protein n=1 Tax=Craspedostauros australis TaxID=1486917 RepID=A0A7R9WUP2_9STRA